MIKTSEKIRLIIKRKGLLIQDVAAQLGYSRQNFSNKLRRDTFYPEELQQVAAAIGCTVDVIFTDTATGEQL